MSIKPYTSLWLLHKNRFVALFWNISPAEYFSGTWKHVYVPLNAHCRVLLVSNHIYFRGKNPFYFHHFLTLKSNRQHQLRRCIWSRLHIVQLQILNTKIGNILNFRYPYWMLVSWIQRCSISLLPLLQEFV